MLGVLNLFFGCLRHIWLSSSFENQLSDNVSQIFLCKASNTHVITIYTYLPQVSTALISIAWRPETRPSHLICGHPTESTRAVGVGNVPVAICTEQIVSDRKSLYKLQSKSSQFSKQNTSVSQHDWNVQEQKNMGQHVTCIWNKHHILLCTLE